MTPAFEDLVAYAYGLATGRRPAPPFVLGRSTTLVMGIRALRVHVLGEATQLVLDHMADVIRDHWSPTLCSPLVTASVVIANVIIEE